MKVTLPKLPIAPLSAMREGDLFVPLHPNLCSSVCALSLPSSLDGVFVQFMAESLTGQVKVVVIGDSDQLPSGLTDVLPETTLVQRVRQVEGAPFVVAGG